MNWTLHIHLPSAALWFTGGLVCGALLCFALLKYFENRAITELPWPFGWR